MNVCENCFSDRELKGFIKVASNNGACSFCSSVGVSIIDLNELLDFFQELASNFKVVDKGPTIVEKINNNWSFFSSAEIGVMIFNQVIPLIKSNINSIGDNVDFIDDIIENYSHWEVLKDELVYRRRFISDISYLEELSWDGFFNTHFKLTPKDKLFRARVHHISGKTAYQTTEMLCPHPNIVGGGRANPIGIPYLYLSDNPQTVLYEVRAAYLDELSIGEFQLNNEYSSIKIVDFTDEVSLYQPTNINTAIKSHVLKKKISSDLSKPMRRYDRETEYIPTQFICEFIKVFTGADGIRFNSSLHPSGKNFVIFDQNQFKCNDVEVMKVNKLSLSATNKM